MAQLFILTEQGAPPEQSLIWLYLSLGHCFPSAQLRGGLRLLVKISQPKTWVCWEADTLHR